MTRPTRRRVLTLAASLPAAWLGRRPRAAQGLSDFTTSNSVPSCSGTRTPTAATREEFYKPNAPVRTMLRTSDVSGTPLRVTGSVIGLKCGVIAAAVVEYWQADARGEYDMTAFRLRGQTRTDLKGGFEFETIVPGAPAGRARRLHVRVTPPHHTALSTEWFFPDDPARTTDPDYRPELVLKRVPSSNGQGVSVEVVFDL